MNDADKRIAFPHAFEEGACSQCGLCDLAEMPCGCDVCWRCLERFDGDSYAKCPECSVAIWVDGALELVMLDTWSGRDEDAADDGDCLDRRVWDLDPSNGEI
jgi:hypothetical protein